MEKDNNEKIKSEHLMDEEEFMDIQTGAVMSRSEFNARIKDGQYPGYYVGVNHPGKLTDNDIDG
jgi:hypothetical protein